MNEFRAAVIGPALLALCACSAGSAQETQSSNTLLPGYTKTGVMASCVEVDQIDSIVVLNESTLLVRGDAATYVNVLTDACRGAGAPDTRVAYGTQQDQLCRDDNVRIIDSGTNTVVTSCTLGSFETLLQIKAGPDHNLID